jgi:hypothetical protein
MLRWKCSLPGRLIVADLSHDVCENEQLLCSLKVPQNFRTSGQQWRLNMYKKGKIEKLQEMLFLYFDNLGNGLE